MAHHYPGDIYNYPTKALIYMILFCFKSKQKRNRWCWKFTKLYILIVIINLLPIAIVYQGHLTKLDVCDGYVMIQAYPIGTHHGIWKWMIVLVESMVTQIGWSYSEEELIDDTNQYVREIVKMTLSVVIYDSEMPLACFILWSPNYSRWIPNLLEKVL